MKTAATIHVTDKAAMMLGTKFFIWFPGYALHLAYTM